MRKVYTSILRVVSLFLGLIVFVWGNGVFAQTQQTFNSSSTFTVPVGVTKITVECWGGGGNGGSSSTNGVKAGGGGGGAYARKLVTVTPSSTYTVTVGAASGDSWFGTNATVMAKGGTSVGNNATAGGVGGSSATSTGDQTYAGGNGASSSSSGTGGGGSSAGSLANGTNASGITGGAAPTNGGAGANGLTDNGKGGNGNIPGGGGSGGWKQGTGGGAGEGASGQVRISYYSLTGTSATSICPGTSSLVTLSSSAAVLPSGSYNVTYNLSGANSATANTAIMTVSNDGTGTFSTSSLPNTGATTITITNLTSGLYSSSIGANNTATFNVTAASQPTISVGGGLTTICSGGSVVLTSSSASTYQWYVDGTPIAGASARNYTAIAIGVYSVVTTNGSGCFSPASVGTTITVNALPSTPVISANGPTEFCADGNLILSSPTASSYQWYKGGVVLGGATNQSYSPTSNGTYSVIVKNAEGCSSAASSGVPVTVNALPPTPNITAGGPTSFCLGGSVTLTSDIATSYQWYNESGVITGAVARDYSTNSTGTYFVRVTNAAGCVAVSSVKAVTNNPLPDITNASQATSQCSNGSAQVSELAYSLPLNSPTTYSITWNTAALNVGFVNVTDDLPAGSIPVTVAPNAPTNTYSGWVTVKNANGCQSSSKSFSVSVTSSPNVSNFGISAANGCAGIGALITVNSTSIANGTYTVKYDLSGSNISNNNTATMTFSGNSGTFTAAAANTGITNITITEVSVVGCSSTVSAGNTASFTIGALPAPPVVTGLDKVCANASINLSVNAAGGVWTSSEPAIAIVNSSGEVTGLTSGTTIITYTTTPNGGGCTSSTDKTITVDAIPIIEAITGPTNICLNTTSNLNDLTLNGNWTSSDPSVASIDNSGLVSALSIGSTLVTYTTAQNAAGCTNFTNVTVSVNAQPGVTAGEDIEVCESATPTAFALSGAALSGGATSAIWSIEAGGGGTLSSQGSGTNPAAVNYKPAANFHGSVVLKLTTNAVGSCGAAIGTRTITINESPKVDAGATKATCQSTSPIDIPLNDAIISGAAKTGTWSIVSGGGTLSSTSPLSDPSTVTYTPVANFNGTVTLRLTTDAAGVCSPATSDKIINVIATPVVDAGTQNSICQSATPVAFSLDGASFSGGATKAAWSIPPGTGTLSSTALTTNPAAVKFTPNANFFGIVKLTLTSDAPGGCSAVTSERTIEITKASTVVAGDPVTVCESTSPGAITLAGAGIGGGATMGQWSISDGSGTLSSSLPTTNPEMVTFTPVANFNGPVSLLLTSNATGNCPSVNATRTITISPNGTITLTSAALTDNQTKCINNPITNITYTVGTNATGAVLTAGGFPTDVHGLFSAGVYTISGTPSVAGTFNYTITTTGSSCINESVSGTITITADGSITRTSAPATTSQTLCINTAISPITYSIGGGANGATVTGLPNGVDGLYDSGTGLFTISGTPTVSGPFTYSVTTTGPCVNPSLGGTINVNANSTISLTSAGTTTSQTTCINTAITPITYSIAGGGTNATITGLPTGVTGSFSGGVYTISGTPTISGAFTYSVTTVGPCNNTSLGGTITISSVAVGGNLSITGVITTPTNVTTLCPTTTESPNSATINLGNQVGSVVKWQYSENGGITWSDVAGSNTGNSLTVQGLSKARAYRAVVHSGACVTDAYSALAIVNVIPAFTVPAPVANPATVCFGQTSALSTVVSVLPTTGIPTEDGDFNQGKDEGWVRDGTRFQDEAGNNRDVPNWQKSNPHNFGSFGNWGDPNDKPPGFAIVNGDNISVLQSPIFSLTSNTDASLKFTQAIDFRAEGGDVAIGTIEISVNGTDWDTLKTYTVTAPATKYTYGSPTSFASVNLDLTQYIGLTGLRLKFTYSGTTNSTWAIDGLSTPGGQIATDYKWSGETLNSTTGNSVTALPSKLGENDFIIKTYVGGCYSGEQTVKVMALRPVSFPDGTQPTTTTVCVGDPAIFTGKPIGDNVVFTWQRSADGGTTWNDIKNAAPNSVVSSSPGIGTPNSSTLTIATTIDSVDHLYRLSAANVACNLQSVAAPLRLNYVWKGTNDTLWSKATNWDAGVVPDINCKTVYILGNRNFQPTIDYLAPGINDLRMMDKAKLTITSAGTLTVAGHIYNTNPGSVIARWGTLNMNAPTAFAPLVNQSIDANTFQYNDLFNLNLDKDGSRTITLNGVTGDTLKLYGTLSFTGGNGKNLVSDGRLTLRSIASGTARVDDLTNGGNGNTNTVTGDVTVERYLKIGSGSDLHPKSWQFLATPTQGQSTYQSWMENGSLAPTGYGTQVVSPFGTGFDAVAAMYPSMKFYRPGTNYDPTGPDWQGIMHTTDPIYSENGYMLFVRGDRSIQHSGTPPNSTTLRTKGTLLTYEKTVPTGTYQFTSIGNPYASAINFGKVVRNNVDPFYTVWISYLGGLYGYGAYDTYTSFDGGTTYESTDGQPGVSIQSGQAFFVQTTGGTGSLTFSESSKTVGSSNYVFRAGASNNIQLLRTNLYYLNSDGSTFHADGNVVQFGDKFNNKIDGMDGRKFFNSGVNLTIQSNKTSLVVERRQLPEIGDTIFMNLTGTKVQKYRFVFVGQGLQESGLQAFLEDHYLNTLTPINMGDTTRLDFKIENVKESYAANRFDIVFKQAIIIPPTIISVEATGKDQDVRVDWKVAHEKNVEGYEIQRSSDEVQFSKMGTMIANNTDSSTYTWNDQFVLPGYYYYRIKMVEKTGKVQYSKTVKVLIGNGKPVISIYPNPIVNGIINVQFINQPAGKYGIRLMNQLGQIIASKQIIRMNGSNTESIQWNYNLAHGIYQLQIMYPNGELKVIKVIY